MEKQLIDYEDKEKLAVILNTVAKGASPAEFLMFIEMCKGTGLNPFKRELWFIKDDYGKVQMMTGINGFYQIANSNPAYDGTETIEGNFIEHKEGDQVFLVPESITSKVWRKDRKFPQVATAYWREFMKPCLTSKGKLSIWGRMPTVMLTKCSDALALRKAFPQELNGLFCEEEITNDNTNINDIKKDPNGADNFNIPPSKSDEKAQANAQAVEALEKKELLQQMINAGTSFKYYFGDDLAKEEKKKVWDVLKTLNSQPDPKNKCIHCAEQVKELDLYLLVDPEQLEQALGAN